MPGILFTATPSNDVVKELQDKVISLHEHEVSFLNDTIANMLTMVGIGVAIITAFFSWAYVYVRNSNKQAQEKMAKAAEQLEIAERKNVDLDQKMAEANQILTDAKSIANIAHEKLVELEEEQKKIKNKTERLNLNAQFDLDLDRNKAEIERIKENLSSLSKMIYPFFSERRLKLSTDCLNLESDFHKIKELLTKEILLDGNIAKHVDKITTFITSVNKLSEEYHALEEDMSESNTSNNEQ